MVITIDITYHHLPDHVVFSLGPSTPTPTLTPTQYSKVFVLEEQIVQHALRMTSQPRQNSISALLDDFLDSGIIDMLRAVNSPNLSSKMMQILHCLDQASDKPSYPIPPRNQPVSRLTLVPKNMLDASRRNL